MAENARPPIDGGAVLVTGASAGIGRELALQLAPRAGRAYRIAMRALPLLPRELSRRQAARSAARIRNTAKGAASAPDRPGGEVRT